MNIAYLSTFYPYRGGIAQFNANLYRALEAQNHDVSAFTFTRQYPEFLFPGKTQLVTENDIADPIHAVRVLDSVNPLSWPKTIHEIQASKPDILVMKYWMSYMAPCLGYVAGGMKKSSTVITVVDNAIPHEKKFFDRAFARYFLNRNHKFIAMSESVKNDILSIRQDAEILVKDHPLYDHFGALIAPQVAKQRLNLDPNKKTLLFFGFIRDYKGLDLLLEAFKNLGNEFQLVIAGESYGSFEKYQNMINDHPRKQDIHAHVRYIDDNEVPLFFGCADAVILPYKSATQSGISAIAYHFDIPIIATDVGGLKETILDGKTGIIIETPHPDSIVKGIHRFYASHSSHWHLHIQELKKELSWEKFAKTLVEFAIR